MEADAVLRRARSGDVPADWNVWPLRRGVVVRSAIGWSFVGIVGLFMLAVVGALTIPDNFTHGGVGIVLTGILLIVLAVVGFGGIGIAAYDVWRIAHTRDYLLVMTPTDYVKAEPRKTTHVPMEHIAHVTLRGVKLPVESDLAMMSTNRTASSRLLGNLLVNWRQPKQPPSLAFVDTRTDQEVIVCTDNSFDEIIAVEQILLIHAGRKERTHTG
jgi:hypothetical protein